MTVVRLATAADAPAIWSILEPVFRAGDTRGIARLLVDATG